MKKYIVCFTLCALLCALSVPAQAQQPKTIARIGFLGSSSAERDKSRLAAFRQGLRDLGYIESNDIVIEQRYAAGQFEALLKLAAELLGRGINVLVTEGTPAAPDNHLRHSKFTVLRPDKSEGDSMKGLSERLMKEPVQSPGDG